MTTALLVLAGGALLLLAGVVVALERQRDAWRARYFHACDMTEQSIAAHTHTIQSLTEANALADLLSGRLVTLLGDHDRTLRNLHDANELIEDLVTRLEEKPR